MRGRSPRLAGSPPSRGSRRSAGASVPSVGDLRCRTSGPALATVRASRRAGIRLIRSCGKGGGAFRSRPAVGPGRSTTASPRSARAASSRAPGLSRVVPSASTTPTLTCSLALTAASRRPSRAPQPSTASTPSRSQGDSSQAARQWARTRSRDPVAAGSRSRGPRRLPRRTPGHGRRGEARASGCRRRTSVHIRYEIEVKSWIPQPRVVDPEVPFANTPLSRTPPSSPLTGPRAICHSPSPGGHQPNQLPFQR